MIFGRDNLSKGILVSGLHKSRGVPSIAAH
jgi:hypothetical protein